MTIVGWQWGILKALEAQGELECQGVSAEILDIRTIVPLDVDTIVRSVAKTGRLVVISEARKRGGFGNDIMAAVAEKCFGSLKGRSPLCYVGGKDYPLPFGFGERYIMPDKDDLIAGVRRVLGS